MNVQMQSKKEGERRKIAKTCLYPCLALLFPHKQTHPFRNKTNSLKGHQNSQPAFTSCFLARLQICLAHRAPVPSEATAYLSVSAMRAARSGREAVDAKKDSAG